MADVYADAMRSAINGDLEMLDATLREHPGLMHTVSFRKQRGARLGFLADLARSTASAAAVDLAMAAFVRELPRSSEFSTHALVACYADRHGFFDCRFDAAVVLLQNAPKYLHGALAQAGIARWVASTNAMLLNHALSFVSRVPNPQYDTAAVDTLVHRVSKHIVIGQQLVLWLDRCDENAVRATSKLLMLLGVWRQRTPDTFMLERAATICEAMIWQLLAKKKNPEDLAYVAANAAANAAVLMGFHHLPPFLREFLVSCPHVHEKTAMRVCDCGHWTGTSAAHQLRSLSSLQAALPHALEATNELGNNVYAEVAKKLFHHPQILESERCVGFLRQVFAHAPPFAMVRLNYNALCPAEIVVLSVCRISNYTQDAARQHAHDAVAQRVLRADGLAEAFGLLPPHSARVSVLNLVKTGMLKSAVTVLRTAIRRPMRIMPGGIGISAPVMCAHLQMFLNRTNGHLMGVPQFMSSCQQLAAMDVASASCLTHRLLPLPPPCLRKACAFFTYDAVVTKTQLEAAFAVYCAIEAAARRKAKARPVPRLPPEIVLLVLGFVSRVDLGHYTGWFR